MNRSSERSPSDYYLLLIHWSDSCFDHSPCQNQTERECNDSLWLCWSGVFFYRRSDQCKIANKPMFIDVAAYERNNGLTSELDYAGQIAIGAIVFWLTFTSIHAATSVCAWSGFVSICSPLS